MVRIAPAAACAALALAACATAAETGANAEIETLATFDSRPGNPAVGPDGRTFVSMHPLDGPEFKVREVAADGSHAPYPTEAWASAPDANGIGLAAVIGVDVDPDGVLWILDMGAIGLSPKLVGWDTTTETLKTVITLPQEALSGNSFVQDFAIDHANRRAFIADMTQADLRADADPAIIVVDLTTGRAARRLENHDSLAPTEDGMTVGPVTMSLPQPDGSRAPARIGLNPIAYGPFGDWVYYGAMTGTDLYRVKGAVLADDAASRADREGAIERVGFKPVSDGMAADVHEAAGGQSIVVTDLANDAVGRVGLDGLYTLIAQDAARLAWVDGVDVAADGSIIATVNRLHQHPAFSGAADIEGPFELVRITAR